MSHEQLEISCQSCGSKLLVELHMRTARCPFCASTSIVERPSSRNRPEPTFIVGFVIDQESAADIVRNWIRTRGFFTRSDFKAAAAEFTRGVYLPAYLYGAIADSDYSASIGEDYTEIETYTTTDSKGNTVTHTRTVTRTEWRSLSGDHTCYVLDVIVSASRGVSNAALEAIEPFDLRALRRYNPSYISGWLAEDPTRSQDDCFELAHNESRQKIGGMLKGFMPGDSHTGLQYHVRLRDEVIDLVLLPVWSFAVRYHADKPPVRLLVNGQTGRVGGRVPVSVVKVTVAILIGVGAVVGIVFIFMSQR